MTDRQTILNSAAAASLLIKRPDLLQRLGTPAASLRSTSLGNGMGQTEPSHSADFRSAVEESIIELVDRPICFVTDGRFDLPSKPEIAQRLAHARRLIEPRLSGVGRVELFDGFTKWPIGTAFVVADGIAVTNRHVAERFALRDADGKIDFRREFNDRPYQVWIDFAEEKGSSLEKEIRVAEVLFLADANTEADLALLRLEPGPSWPRPIPLLARDIAIGDWVAVVGYPVQDDRLPPAARDVEESYFGGVYGVKRLAPGEIDAPVGNVPDWVLCHDGTTLGGNSGSALLDLKTGSAAGVHFRGVYRKTNYAVRSTELLRIMNRLGLAAIAVEPPIAPASPPLLGEDEGPSAHPSEFEGYRPSFINADDPLFTVPLPVITDGAPGNVAVLKDGINKVLTYRNFSVVMRADRRLCCFSAVNIDGANTFSIKGPRPRWKTDDRLDEDLQIIGECYGEEQDGKFSRGHMTRREDPNWGHSREEAAISNRHTFYVTNACPQIQPFNAGIWLSLEDYALENADQDDMRISVFTGPVFRDSGPNADPEYFGVQIPVEYWKVIAFKHDRTKQLSATAYRMSQRALLPSQNEAVFGQFRQSQVTIRSVERDVGIDFGHLRDHDPFDTGEELAGTMVRPIQSLQDIVLAGGARF